MERPESEVAGVRPEAGPVDGAVVAGSAPAISPRFAWSPGGSVLAVASGFLDVYPVGGEPIHIQDQTVGIAWRPHGGQVATLEGPMFATLELWDPVTWESTGWLGRSWESHGNEYFGPPGD